MLTLPAKGFRSLVWLLTLCLGIGTIASAAMVVYLVVLAFQGNYVLPLVLPEGLELSHIVRAESLGPFLAYTFCLFAFLAIGLYVLYLLRSMASSLAKKKAFTQALPAQVRRMGFCVFIIAYVRQLLLLLAFRQDMGTLADLLEFRFLLLPSEAVYAIVLLVLSQVFAYALGLQSEYEQTV